MSPKRQIKGKEFIEDLHAGMTTAEIMEKYQLSPEGLRRIFRILLDSSAVSSAQLDAMPTLYEDSDQAEGLRRTQRKKIPFDLPVCDDIDSLTTGKVLDVSEGGIRVSGVKCRVGQSKTLMVRPSRFGKCRPFVFEAVCRWVSGDPRKPETTTAGFEITRISALDSAELKKLIIE
jgi:hypothetical protein